MRFLNKRVKPFYPSMDMDGSRVGVQLHDSRFAATPLAAETAAG